MPAMKLLRCAESDRVDSWGPKPVETFAWTLSGPISTGVVYELEEPEGRTLHLVSRANCGGTFEVQFMDPITGVMVDRCGVNGGALDRPPNFAFDDGRRVNLKFGCTNGCALAGEEVVLHYRKDREDRKAEALRLDFECLPEGTDGDAFKKDVESWTADGFTFAASAALVPISALDGSRAIETGGGLTCVVGRQSKYVRVAPEVTFDNGRKMAVKTPGYGWDIDPLDVYDCKTFTMKGVYHRSLSADENDPVRFPAGAYAGGFDPMCVEYWFVHAIPNAPETLEWRRLLIDADCGDYDYEVHSASIPVGQLDGATKFDARLADGWFLVGHDPKPSEWLDGGLDIGLSTEMVPWTAPRLESNLKPTSWFTVKGSLGGPRRCPYASDGDAVVCEKTLKPTHVLVRGYFVRPKPPPIPDAVNPRERLEKLWGAYGGLADTVVYGPLTTYPTGLQGVKKQNKGLMANIVKESVADGYGVEVTEALGQFRRVAVDGDLVLLTFFVV
jgi:hypothetical protein